MLILLEKNTEIKVEWCGVIPREGELLNKTVLIQDEPLGGIKKMCGVKIENIPQFLFWVA